MKKEDIKRLNIEIPKKLRDEFKAIAIKRNVSLKILVIRAILEYLGKNNIK
jgi:hypothetical protein